MLARGWPVADILPLIRLVEDVAPAETAEAADGRYRLSEEQARAILDLRLHRLTGLEREKIADELKQLGTDIAEYLGILGTRARLLAVLRDELLAVRAEFANPRRTRLEEEGPDASDEDLIQREEMVVTVTSTGYIKRVPLSTYRAQRRGGKGRSGMTIRDEDFVSRVFVASTHTPVLFFSSSGMVYKLKVYKLPLGTPQARGKAMINLLPLQPGETITTLMPLPEDEGRWAELYVGFATRSGNVRRNALSDFTNVPSSGKIAMKLDAGDRLVRVRTFTDDDDILLITRGGQCIRFAVGEVRVFSGRTSTGVRGLKLAADDEVISMSGLRHVDIDAGRREEYLRAINARRRIASSDYAGKDEDLARDQALAAKLDLPEFAEMADTEEFLLTVTEDGFGKRTSSYEYRITGRDGSGVGAIDLGRAQGTSTVIGAFPVLTSDQIVMVTEAGQLIRCPVDGISIMGRTARGVKLFAMADGDRVVSVTRIREVVDANGPGGDESDGEGDNGNGGGAPDLFDGLPGKGSDAPR
jgi:DNA gyrase subunit A